MRDLRTWPSLLPCSDLVRPMQQFHATVEMFDQSGAALHPVAVVIIGNSVYVAEFRGVDVSAHYPVDPARALAVRGTAP